MPAIPTVKHHRRHTTGRFKDLVVTLLLWAYFTAGFVVFFSPRYLFARLFTPDFTTAFQRLNNQFYRGFFTLCRFLIPSQTWEIASEIKQIKGAIVLSNHVSYLDPILLISLFPKHTTIAKARLFKIPLFKRFLALSGYVPSTGQGPYADLFLNSLESLSTHLARGGNIFAFPEGRRSRDGKVGPLHRGIFKIARHCRAPIVVLGIHNTDKLFEPGRFLFHAGRPNTIRVEQVARLEPDYEQRDFSINTVMDQVHQLLTRASRPAARTPSDT